MSVRPQGAPVDPAGRNATARRLAEEFWARRRAGEAGSEAELLAEHVDLSGEIERELRKLALIARAGDLARGGDSQDGSAGSAEAAIAPPPLLELPGYELVREVHRGGQGVVFQAFQKSTRRSVAIKLLHAAASSRAEQARFEREVLILGQLRHPNIVAIHDSGVTPEGRCYFVMDYIAGEALDAHAETVRRSLLAELSSRRTVRRPLAPLLHLFATICDAVQAAHLQGVIHRDLKPGNIRVDLAGQPHVLDFGLAKLTAAAEADASSLAAMTTTGQFVGSLPWASPEQARGAAAAVDVRSDVYSLGVVLHQALSGAFPYPVAGAVPDVLARIIDAPATRPSEALRRRLAAVGAGRPVLLSVSRVIDADLDTIILTCLQKDPARRYQSVGALADDIRRYLAGEALAARRDSPWYVARALLRRYRIAAGVAAAFVLLLLGSSVAITLLYAQARQQAQVAEQRREQAERQAARARRVQEFLQQTLALAESGRVRGRDTTLVREMLDEAARDVGAALAAEPGVEAAVRQTLGQTYAALALPAAQEHFLAEVAARRRDPDGTLLELAAALGRAGTTLTAWDKPMQAEPLLREALAIQHEDPAAPADALRTLGWLASCKQRQGDVDAAETLAREALDEGRRARGDGDGAVDALDLLAEIAVARGRYESVEPLLGEALQTRIRLDGDRSISAATGRWRLGNFLAQRGQLDRAEPLLRQALAAAQAQLGPDSPDLPMYLQSLSLVLRQKKQLDEAERLALELLRIRRRNPIDASGIAVALGELASVHWDRGDLTAAETPLREAIELRRAAWGADDPRVADGIETLATILRIRGDAAAAGPLLEDAVRIRSIAAAAAAAGEDAPQALARLARTLRPLGQIDAAEAALRRALDLTRAGAGVGAPAYEATLNELLLMLLEAERFDRAEPVCREFLALRQRRFARDSLEAAEGMIRLATALRGQRCWDEAEALLSRALSIARGAGDRAAQYAAEPLFELGLVALGRGDPAAAEPLLAESAAIRERINWPGHYQTARTQSALGECLTRLGRYEEAEAKLKTAREALRRLVRDDQVEGRLVLERLARLYDVQGREVEAAACRAMLGGSGAEAARDDRE